tara:strand:+ start:322 stop:1170 length:849 start_codon:yes stop_codon:yes gene_type:complete
MSFLDRIKQCNNVDDFSKFIPFVVEGARVGWIHHKFCYVLKKFDQIFEFFEKKICLSPQLVTYQEKTMAIDCVVKFLAEEGWIAEPSDELYPVSTGFYTTPFFEMDRSAISRFGVSAHGIHINGFVSLRNEIFMWIGRRADDKSTYPGQLDNMVAGGQPVGLSLRDNILKECAEEAAIPPDLARKAKAVGSITYQYEENNCLKPDTMFVFDLELPSDFNPINTDGEVADFKLLPVREVMSITADTTAFKFNCAAVNIDFFIRHGLLLPENRDYIEIQRGLHQ